MASVLSLLVSVFVSDGEHEAAHDAVRQPDEPTEVRLIKRCHQEMPSPRELPSCCFQIRQQHSVSSTKGMTRSHIPQIRLRVVVENFLKSCGMLNKCPQHTWIEVSRHGSRVALRDYSESLFMVVGVLVMTSAA